MSKLFTRILTSTAIVSAMSVTAFAGSPMLEKADTNQDGLIQLSEFTAMADQKFSKMDADGNGLVTKEERQAAKQQRREDRALKQFAKADADGDGSISETEFMAARAARADHMKQKRDVNGDGQVDQEDRDARKAKFKKMHKKMKGKKGHKKGQHADQHASKRAKVDTNGDGAVDLAEHQVATLAHFERMDKNADGVLSADEQRRPKGKRHGKKRHGMRQ